jgi:hypothetical protein
VSGAGAACGIFTDGDQASLLANTAALGAVMQNGENLVGWEAGAQERRTFSFAEALLPGAAGEQASLRRSVVSADG